MILTRTLRLLMLAALGASSASAQTLDDGLLIPKKTLTTGVMYAHDSWNEYWEGSLKRTNGNIGTLTTQSVAWVGGYGVTDRLSLMATLPYVWTHASQGVLHDLSGFQDLTFAAKFRLLSTGPTGKGILNAFLVGAAAVPIGDYTPDFYPLSIGTGGSRAAARLTVGYESTSAWFANASSGYTFCNNVRLNRNSYFTDGQLFLTNEVTMPNVLENSISVGASPGNWRIPVSLVQRHTLGGGDIRRQDMPFVSNRMDFVRLDGGVMYRLPKSLTVGFGAGRVLNGRNVGQSTTFTSGLSYALHF
jgi:hypothetical protein